MQQSPNVLYSVRCHLCGMIGEQFSVEASHGAGSTSSDRGFGTQKSVPPALRVSRWLAVSTLYRLSSEGKFWAKHQKHFFNTRFLKGIEDNRKVNELYETCLILYMLPEATRNS
jgi:predicted restriction endonuclease